MRIAILGAPGSGKGTQAQMLATRHKIPWMSIGSLVREAVKDGTKLDAESKAALAEGEVPEHMVLALLEDRLRARDSKRGFIIADFPTNIPQAQALDALLEMLGRALQITLSFNLDDETLMKRISGRMACNQCYAIYHRHDCRPKSRGKCDECEGKLFSANGGRARHVAEKIATYHKVSDSLFTYYKAQHKLRTVVATGNVEEVEQKICDIVDLEIRPLEIQTTATVGEVVDEEVGTVIAGGQINRLAPPPKLPEQPDSMVEIVSTPVRVRKTRKDATVGKKKVVKKPVAKKRVVKNKVAKKPARKTK